MKTLLALLVITIASTAFTEIGECSSPWSDPSRALVIDPYQANPIDWDLMAGETRLVGIIHKATTGARKLDSEYRRRREEAKKRGYLWGSYHWGEAGDPIEQADYYIDQVQPEPDEVIALDLEDVTSSKLMGIADAERFIARVKERTGRYPLVYANHRVTAILAALPDTSVFARTRLWYARFRPDIPDFPAGLWRTYTLWQFSSELCVQYRIPGTPKDMDVNVFNGTPEELRAAWPFTAE